MQINNENISQIIGNLGLDSAVLLVIDIQNDFCHDQGAFSRMGVDLSYIQGMIPKLKNFIEEIRSTSIPIIFVKNVYDSWTLSEGLVNFKRIRGKEVKMCEEGKWGSDFFEIRPDLERSERIVIKHRYSAFRDTQLDLILRSIGRDILILSGVTTNVCVETTARDGFMRDYRIIVLEDCTAATSIQEHEAALFNIRNYFGFVARSKDIISRLTA